MSKIFAVLTGLVMGVSLFMVGAGVSHMNNAGAGRGVVVADTGWPSSPVLQ